MKRLIVFYAALLLLFSSAFANGVKIGELYYVLDEKSKTASVTYSTYSLPSSSNPSYSNLSGAITIPSKVEYNRTEYPVTSIGKCAFEGCSGLTSVTIPNSVTEIGGWAFCDCSGLTSVTIPNSVTSIGERAFLWCTGLTKVEISDIEAWCKIKFSESGSNPLYYTRHLYLNENEVKDLVIPNSVTSIGNYAFEGCKVLTSVTIGNSVTSIGSFAFSDCTGLTSVTIPNSVKSIGNYAFNGCTGLTSVTIPNSVTSISFAAFSDCTGLTSVTIPNSVTSIGNYAFRGCTGLTSVTIPNSVTSIGNYAFEGCKGLTSVTIPNSVTEIGNYAFYRCSGLTSVTIGNSVTLIGDKAFYDCSGLTKVEISDIEAWCKIEFSGVYSNPLYYAHHLYLNGNEVKDLVIPNSITEIGRNAFDGCSGLTSVTIPNSVTSIGNYAFRGCKGLKSLTCMAPIPPKCDNNPFSDSIYKDCVLYVLINYLDDYKNREPWKNFNYIEGWGGSEIELNNIRYFIDETSKKAICTGIVDPHSFSGTITIAESIEYEGATYQVSEILEKAFVNCALMQGVIIPPSIKTIGKDAFSGCTGLVKNAYPDNISNPFPSGLSVAYPADNCLIENGAIYNSNKTSLYFVSADKSSVFIVPNTITNITENAFASCGQITEIKLPEILTKIAASAFRNCSNLQKINIPSGINSIASELFAGCSRLSELIIDDSATIISFVANCFKDNPIKNLYMGRKWTVSNSQTTLFPSLQSLSLGGMLTEIPANAFKGCKDLVRVTIAEGIISIGDYAFDGSGLKELVYNAVNCSSFGFDVFPSSIEKLTIGETVAMIPDNFLGRGNRVQLIDIPNSVRTIGKYAFIDSYNLKSLYLGTGIQSINKDAFYDTTKLNSEYTIPKIFWLGNTPPDGYKYLRGLINYISNNLYDFNNYKVYQYLSSKFEVDGVIYVPLKPSDRTCDVVDCTYGEENKRTLVLENVTNLGIELSVKDISDYAFYDNGVINEVVLANHGSIGKFGFYNCNNIAKIDFPSSITSLGSNCFQNCSSLESVTIGENIMYLPEYVFSKCVSLGAISVPANVESIQNYAFEGCNSLAYLRFEESFIDKDNDGRFDEEILTLGSNGGNPLFADCPLISLFIGRKINYRATDQYGYSPFYRCKTLETAEITDREVQVYNYEFYACESLKTLSIGNGVTSIGKWAFSGCRSLEYFSAGYNLQTIGEEAFSDCTGLTEYYSYSENPPVCGYQALDDINKWICTLYVPLGQELVYSSRDQWKDFFFIEEMAPVTIENIVLNSNELTLEVGETFVLIASLYPSNASNTHIVWVSNNPSVATVSDDGIVKAVSEGTATVTARIGEVYAECQITVSSSVNPGDAVEYIYADEAETVTVFTATGILLMKDAPRDNLHSLSPGIYIINGKKVLVK